MDHSTGHFLFLGLRRLGRSREAPISFKAPTLSVLVPLCHWGRHPEDAGVSTPPPFRFKTFPSPQPRQGRNNCRTGRLRKLELRQERHRGSSLAYGKPISLLTELADLLG